MAWTDWIPTPLRRAGSFVLRPAVRADVLHEWRRRRGDVPVLGPAPVRRVLVICHGNICRSPFAAALLGQRVKPEMEIRSAGLHAVDGKPAEAGARRVASRFGVDLENHGARRLTAEDLAWADLILGMEGRHAAGVGRLSRSAARKTHLLGDFLDTPPHRIPDPWGEADEVFEATFARIAQAVDGLAARLDGAAP